MLEINTGRSVTCDGVTRRDALRVGFLGMLGLSLPELLRIRAASAAVGRPVKDTSVIQVFLSGGPSHFETFDPKPNAPKEFRGELGAISTALPGVSLSELMPETGSALARMAIVRSLRHTTADHGSGAHWLMTGFPAPQGQVRNNARPSTGSIVSKVRGASRSGVPAYVTVPNNGPFAQAAYLGPGFNPFSVGGDPVGNFKVRNLDLVGGLSLERLEDRRYLMSKLDRFNRDRDASGTMAGIDDFAMRAYEMVTGPAAREAFDLDHEDPRLRDRYGRTRIGQSCLLARRLVESGVTFVTVNDGNWDHHGQVAQNCKTKVPPLDRALSTLVNDLHDRGLAERVLVVVWGEFGRTPRVNGSGGRDHWPNAMSVLLAGGGLEMGQVIGATNSKGESPTDRPVGPEDILQTVYHVLGIDPAQQFLNDAGRPMAILGTGKPLVELI